MGRGTRDAGLNTRHAARGTKVQTRDAGRGTTARMTLAALVGCISLGALACSDVSTNPSVAIAIEFDSLPWPAVVAGDTMRDSAGNVVALRAIAFNSKGDTILGAPVRFLSPDAAFVTIDSNGILV